MKGTQHSLRLTWNYAASNPDTIGAIVAFKVYRGEAPGGAYTLLNTIKSVPDGQPHSALYTDLTGVPGTKYVYVVTAVDSIGDESDSSNEADGIALINPPAPTDLTVDVQ